MGKYTKDAEELLRLVGGKGNIAAVSHCMTRMRFVLGDPAKADIKGIEAMKVVKRPVPGHHRQRCRGVLQ